MPKRKGAGPPVTPRGNAAGKAKSKGGRPASHVALKTAAEKEASSSGSALVSVASMFGSRGPPERLAPAFACDMEKWMFGGVDGEENLPQKQLLLGDVLYAFFTPPKFCTLISMGSEATEQVYYVHTDTGVEVTIDHPERNPNARRRGGDGQVQIEVFTTWLARSTAAGTGEQLWVSARHVQSERRMAGRASERGNVPHRHARIAPSCDDESGGGDDLTTALVVPPSPATAAAATAGTAPAAATATHGDQAAAASAAPAAGVGRAAATQFYARKRKKRVRCFMSGWLDDYNWLVSFPERTAAEWDERPEEEPLYLTCNACTAYPKSAHKVTPPLNPPHPRHPDLDNPQPPS